MQSVEAPASENVKEAEVSKKKRLLRGLVYSGSGGMMGSSARS